MRPDRVYIMTIQMINNNIFNVLKNAPKVQIFNHSRKKNGFDGTDEFYVCCTQFFIVTVMGKATSMVSVEKWSKQVCES